MNAITIIMGIFLFAIATVIIFSWGLIKQKNQTSDLMRLLFSKGESMVKKYLKKNDYITMADIEKMSEDLTAGFPLSRNRAIVKDKKDYAAKLVEYMEKTGQVTVNGSIVTKVKKSKRL